ncbi:unnamed protein product [Bursaphelenchus okinawaensis]|uniref:Uncharacterized protein n=1 Tax=Bursaphelenchus okinawaensis TaxID=465554 RepID=A0A811JVJ7_9BILA|nr:unnamed protein product [Bursaphelenchus okinawaensis]CAG9085266.1 unnamed protein product [Bursaphelenchus okinawaensis]
MSDQNESKKHQHIHCKHHKFRRVPKYEESSESPGFEMFDEEKKVHQCPKHRTMHQRHGVKQNEDQKFWEPSVRESGPETWQSLVDKEGSKQQVPRDRINFDPTFDETPDSLDSDRSESQYLLPFIKPDSALTVPPEKLLIRDYLKKDSNNNYTLERHISINDPNVKNRIVDSQLLRHVIKRNEEILTKACICQYLPEDSQP